MASVTAIEIRFSLCREDGESDNRSEEFDATDSNLQDTVDEFFVELVEEFNDEKEDDEGEWAENGYKVESYDGDFADPADFEDLNDYGRYAWNVEEYGEAFHLRWEDIGELSTNDFDDTYRGCWGSAEEYIQHVLDELFDITLPAFVHIDWERTARDGMMDQSEYEGDEGLHDFDNH